MWTVWMPHYYLNLFNDSDCIDEEGGEYADLAAAKDAAIAAARGMMAENILRGKPITLHHRIDIVNHQRKVLATMRFRELVTIVE